MKTLEVLFANYPDIVKEVVLPMGTAILAIAFPLLLQTITRIDDKYGSTRLVDTFIRREWITRCYIGSLVILIAGCIFWMLQLPRCIELGFLNEWVDHSALILLVVSLAALLILTFAIAYQIYVFYHPLKLSQHLEKRHDSSTNKKEKILFFTSISDLLFYAIQKDDEELSRFLQEFYYRAIIRYREERRGSIIEYPQEYYNSMFAANEMVCQRKRKKISLWNASFFVELVLDRHQRTIMSPQTNIFIWKCILQALSYDKEDYIMSYWTVAHQFYDLTLLHTNMDHSGGEANEENRAEREKAQKAFLELHYALGGLLMYLRKHKLLRKILRYSKQIPPKYVLVPESLEDVIDQYMATSERLEQDPFYYARNYQHPDMDAPFGDTLESIPRWIKYYLGVLFLRQYTLVGEVGLFPPRLKLLTPPKDLHKLRYWEEGLDELRQLINDIRKDKDLLSELGLSDLCSDDWFRERGKKLPNDLIDELQESVNRTKEEIQRTQSLDSQKVERFKQSTKEILGPVLKFCSQISRDETNPTTPSNEHSSSKEHSLFVGGGNILVKKEAFGESQGIGYGEVDTITAEQIALNISRSLSNGFQLMSAEKYVLQTKDVFNAIDRLNLDPEQFIIVAMGVNLPFFLASGITNLEEGEGGKEWSYKGMRIICIDSNEWMGVSMLVLRKADMPLIRHEKTNKDTISRYGLKSIDEEDRIYTNIIDLNQHQELKKELENDRNEDLGDYVLVCVELKIEMRYKLNAPCIQLKIFSSFEDRGSTNTPSEVKNLWR